MLTLCVDILARGMKSITAIKLLLCYFMNFRSVYVLLVRMRLDLLDTEDIISKLYQLKYFEKLQFVVFYIYQLCEDEADTLYTNLTCLCFKVVILIYRATSRYLASRSRLLYLIGSMLFGIYRRIRM